MAASLPSGKYKKGHKEGKQTRRQRGACENKVETWLYGADVRVYGLTYMGV